MEFSNSQSEMLWVEGWNDLDQWVSRWPHYYLVDESWMEVTVDECREIIQRAAYEKKARVRFHEIYYKGTQAIQYSFESVT